MLVTMNKKALEKFRKIIETEKQKVIDSLGHISAEIDSMSSGKSSGSQGYSNHMADIGSDSIEQEQTFLHASQGSDYLMSLEAALKRIDEGTYGICEQCSGKIPLKRLEAYPAANLCLTCKSEQEKLQRG